MSPASAPSSLRAATDVEVVPAVLVVDDNSANLLAVEAILAPLGYRTVTAGSGADALKQLLLHEFAVILMDVQMPGMDGFEAASAIKSHPRTADIPIIFITAISRESLHVFKGYALGAVDYLLKPFEPEILRAKVAVFLDLYRKDAKIRAQAKQIHEHEIRALQRRSDERYRGLAESMPLPMWRVSTDGTVLTSNRAWLDYSGLTADQTSNLIYGGSLFEEDAEPFRARWNDQIWKQQSSFDLEARLRATDGSHRWHLFRVVGERSERGGAETWIVTATDNDAQKRAHETAEAASRLKDDFLATVSHELRTPLNAIVGWSRMLRDGMLDADRATHAIEAIERNARIQTELVNDILDVSRIISGNLRLRLTSVDLSQVLKDAIETVRPAADGKHVEIHTEVGAGSSHVVEGDAARLQQVVWNLVANAVKFTEAAGKVTVSLVAAGDAHSQIRVQDTGAGISKEFLPYAFDRFRQADGSMSRAHSGLGLGLAIVRHLVELHGGTVAAESEGIGRGSVFTVTLPSGSSAGETSEPTFLVQPVSEKLAVPPRLDGVLVLVVEDQEDAREMVTEMLSHYGAEVVAVETAAEALAALKETARPLPDVIVSDIGLPFQDGYWFIRQVRALPVERGGRLPAIAVTGFARAEDGKRAVAEGFQMHLAKPVERMELVALVASLAHAPRAVC